jgi:hypothetical protein
MIDWYLGDKKLISTSRKSRKENWLIRLGTCDMMPRAKLTKSWPLRSALFPPGNLSCFVFSRFFFFLFVFLNCDSTMVPPSGVPPWRHNPAIQCQQTPRVPTRPISTRHSTQTPTHPKRWKQRSVTSVEDFISGFICFPVYFLFFS